MCSFHVTLAEDRFLVMPPAGDFPAEESHQSPPGLRPRTPLSRAAVRFRPAANLHPTAASVRPCARWRCVPRLISSQSPKASAIAWCPLIAATDCCARFRTPLPWQLFFRALRRNKTSYHSNAARDFAWQLVRHCRRTPRRGGGFGALRGTRAGERLTVEERLSGGACGKDFANSPAWHRRGPKWGPGPQPRRTFAPFLRWKGARRRHDKKTIVFQRSVEEGRSPAHSGPPVCGLDGLPRRGSPTLGRAAVPLFPR